MNLDTFENLKGFRDRFVNEEKERLYNEAFDAMATFAKVIAVMPSYLEEIRHREVSIEEKEKHIRVVIDLMIRVQTDQLKKFNDKIYQANVGVKP